MVNPQDAYRKQNVLTASPVDLIVMLYDGLRKDIRLAARSMDKNDMAASHKYLIMAQDIIAELINSLDLSFSISSDLMSLYEFLLRALGEVNASKDPAQLERILEIVETLRDTWKTVADEQKMSRDAPQEGLG